MVKLFPIDEISFIGGNLAMDFVNSVHDRRTDSPPDYLNTFTDLLLWSKKVSIVDLKSFRLIEGKAHQNIKKSELFLKHAIEVRELLYRIFKGIIQKGKIPKKDLEDYNHLLKEYFHFLQIRPQDDGYSEAWNFDADDLKNITAPIIKSAHELILSDKLERVKDCPNCGWLFFDTTKNGKRRWCSMKACGSNVKALEYYHRQKEKEKD